MSDDLDLDMEVVEDDELDELGADGASSSDQSSRSESGEESPESESFDMEVVEKDEKSLSDPGRTSDSDTKATTDSGERSRKKRLKGEGGDSSADTTLQSLPDDWAVRQLVDDFDIEYGDERAPDEFGDYPLYGANGVIGRTDEYLFEEPVVTVGARGAVANVHLTEPKSWVTNNSLVLLDRTEVNRYFLANALRYFSVERAVTGSAQPQITSGMLGKMDYPAAPLPEQRKIASVLSAVDQAIQKTEAIIEQAQRVKRGLLQDLFSVGIGSDDRLRDPHQDSGSFRETKLGSLPSDWEVIPMGKAISTLYRYPSYYDIEYVDEGVPEVRGELLRPDGTINLNTEEIRYVSEETASEYPRVRLEENDFVISVRGTVGKVGRIPPSLAGGVITANLIRVKFDTDLILPDYAQIMLLSRQFQRRLDALTSATTIKTIKADDLRRIPVRLPDLSEQRRISKVVQSHREIIRKEQAQLDELHRLKKGLMQDLLTGKVRTADKAIDVLDEVEAHG